MAPPKTSHGSHGLSSSIAPPVIEGLPQEQETGKGREIAFFVAIMFRTYETKSSKKNIGNHPSRPYRGYV